MIKRLILMLMLVFLAQNQIVDAAKQCTDLKFQPYLPLETTAGIFGTWYLFEKYAIDHSPVCEYVEFYPGPTDLTFRKKLDTHLNNGSWVTQYQNGTITKPGEVMLDFTYADGSLTNPPLQINYTLVGFHPEKYMIVFYCKKKARVPQIPVLTRSLNPNQTVWNEIFTIIQNAGLNFAWLDLMCRPPPDNATLILNAATQAKKQEELQMLSVPESATSIEKNEVYSYFSNSPPPTPLEQALFAENAIGQFTAKLLSHVEPDVF